MVDFRTGKHVEAVLGGVADAANRLGSAHGFSERLQRAEAEYRRWGIEDASSAAHCAPSPDRVVSAARARELELAATRRAAHRGGAPRNCSDVFAVEETEDCWELALRGECAVNPGLMLRACPKGCCMVGAL